MAQMGCLTSPDRVIVGDRPSGEPVFAVRSPRAVHAPDADRHGPAGQPNGGITNMSALHSHRLIRNAVAAAALALGLGVAAAAPAAADPDPTQVCSGTHITPSGNQTSITYTAPEGMLVSAWCVKAGSTQQGNGPEYHQVDPPAKTITITHASGKDISHYSVTLVPVPETPTETPTPQTPTQQTTTPNTTVNPTTGATPEVLGVEEEKPEKEKPAESQVEAPEAEVLGVQATAKNPQEAAPAPLPLAVAAGADADDEADAASAATQQDNSTWSLMALLLLLLGGTLGGATWYRRARD